MGRYIIRRLLQAIPLIWLLTVLVFTLIHLIPGGPLAVLTNPRMTQEAREAIMRQFGLDQPLYIQYLSWFGNMLTGNFGYSFAMYTPVKETLLQHLWPTVELFVCALIIAALLAIVLGTISAARQGRLVDYALTTVSYFGLSMPVFLLGLLSQNIFAIQLDWFPVAGRESAGFNFSTFEAFLDHIWHLVLPAGVLSIALFAGWSRYVRSSMIEVSKQDYIRTARAKGVPALQVLMRHGLRNAIIPFITVVAINFGALVGGATVTEGIFNWHGMGTLFLSSLSVRDYPVLMAILLLSGIVVVLSNLIADILYAVVDPRIRYS
jgi:peptide/nickel transport system permease protein